MRILHATILALSAAFMTIIGEDDRLLVSIVLPRLCDSFEGLASLDFAWGALSEDYSVGFTFERSRPPRGGFNKLLLIGVASDGPSDVTPNLFPSACRLCNPSWHRLRVYRLRLPDRLH